MLYITSPCWNGSGCHKKVLSWLSYPSRQKAKAESRYTFHLSSPSSILLFSLALLHFLESWGPRKHWTLRQLLILCEKVQHSRRSSSKPTPIENIHSFRQIVDSSHPLDFHHTRLILSYSLSSLHVLLCDFSALSSDHSLSPRRAARSST